MWFHSIVVLLSAFACQFCVTGVVDSEAHWEDGILEWAGVYLCNGYGIDVHIVCMYVCMYVT